LNIPKLLKKAAKVSSNGDLGKATQIYGLILKSDPSNCEANYQLGLLAANLGDRQASLLLLKKAIQANAAEEKYWQGFIDTLREFGQYYDAEKVAEEAKAHLISKQESAVDRENDFVRKLVEYYELENYAQAEQQALLMTQKFPENPFSWKLLGVLVQKSGRLSESLDIHKKAIDLAPEDPDIYYNLAVNLADLGRLDEAVSIFKHAISLKTEFPQALTNLGVVLERLGEVEDAEICFIKAIKISPNEAKIYNNLGIAQHALGKLSASESNYRLALTLEPQFAEAHTNLGNVLRRLGKLREAAESHRTAIKIAPDRAEVHYNLATTLEDLGELEGAIAAYRSALKLRPGYLQAEVAMCHQQQHICDFTAWRSFPELSCQHSDEMGRPSPWINLSWIDNPEKQLALSSAYAKIKFTRPIGSLPQKSARRPERIKVGYFSADFHNFPGMYLMAGLLEHHSREHFEIYAFSYGPPKNDEMRYRIQAAVDHFIDIRVLSDKDVVNLVRGHEIDIAIHRNGYTKSSRTELFQYRLSPIQINYLGYPGSLGADFIDYIIADPVVIPEDQRKHYSEKVIYLPHSYQPNDDKREIAQTDTSRADFGLPENAFVLCCFNNNFKISPREFDIWMRILNDIEKGVLWLLKTNKWAERNLRKEAKQRGVDPSRLVFAERLPQSEHLARHQHADLFIDTFNCNAHTTASDALWAGLPVVTKQGSQFAARVSASLLNSIGLSELIVNTQEEYEALVLELATDTNRLNALKSKLARNRLTKPLFDTKQYTRHFEMGLRQAYDRYFEGKKAVDIWVHDDPVRPQ